MFKLNNYIFNKNDKNQLCFQINYYNKKSFSDGQKCNLLKQSRRKKKRKNEGGVISGGN